MTTIYKDAELFGGAITVKIPSNFIDASNIRQVPDAQEVFLDADGFTSIIFDITERVLSDPGKTDRDALLFHFEDIFSEETEYALPEVQDLTSQNDRNESGQHIPTYMLCSRIKHSALTRSSSGLVADSTIIVLLLIRLVRQQTDIVITINLPHVSRGFEAGQDVQQSELEKSAAIGKEYAEVILNSFQIKEWGLFVQE
ncbi:hypothetical protein B0A49_08428 [Cryomyces minteri]|uniref:Ran guanine nucleotide release factor n=1 Tax=Cryomyces minteri TaxID=331657 RepID=A0A4U0WUA1_9PEZI|nr:hypothetical protein B0A49_08428 [Cryomyces minteri]